MLEFATTSLEYRRYDIFVGVYPNDERPSPPCKPPRAGIRR